MKVKVKVPPNPRPQVKPRLKRWPISQKRRTALYEDISESIMDLRVKVYGAPRHNILEYEADDLLFVLKQEIWRKVCKTLGIPT